MGKEGELAGSRQYLYSVALGSCLLHPGPLDRAWLSEANKLEGLVEEGTSPNTGVYGFPQRLGLPASRPRGLLPCPRQEPVPAQKFSSGSRRAMRVVSSLLGRPNILACRTRKELEGKTVHNHVCLQSAASTWASPRLWRWGLWEQTPWLLTGKPFPVLPTSRSSLCHVPGSMPTMLLPSSFANESSDVGT